MQRFPELIAPYAGWSCAACGEVLVPGPVRATYMGSEFVIELPRCACCGLAIVPEDLATGKMLEVEQILEDK